jgi:hypothetical protein
VKVHYLGSAYNSRAHSGCDDAVRSIRTTHLANKAEGYSDIAYNMLVCEHGYTFEGRGAHKKTGANGNSSLNAGHYAVCALLGSSGLTKPSDAMLNGIRDAIEWLRANGDAGAEIKGHRDGYATACPGSALYAWVKKGAPRPGGTSTPAPSTSIVPKSRESAATMKKQAAAALKSWPFIPDVEKAHGLSANLLLALGSRETNLTNKLGDGGHGHGVWQRDDRWWDVDASYLTDVRKQAEDAATLLVANHKALGNWPAAIAAYNAGVTGVKTAVAAGKSADAATTGGDYAADVLGRQAYIKAATPAPKPAKPKYEPFPGVGWFDMGRKSPIVAAMHKRLVAVGCNRYKSSANSDVIGSGDVASYEAWQHKCGYTGAAAKWPPGKSTWDRLQVPNA